MQQRTHRPGIQTVRHGPLKLRSRHPARPALRLAALAKVRHTQALAAARAQWTRLFGKFVPAGFANGNATEGGKRVAANSAVSGKQDGTQTVPGTSKHANHCAPRRRLARLLVQRHQVTSTGEGAPRSLLSVDSRRAGRAHSGAPFAASIRRLWKFCQCAVRKPCYNSQVVSF